MSGDTEDRSRLKTPREIKLEQVLGMTYMDLVEMQSELIDMRERRRKLLEEGESLLQKHNDAMRRASLLASELHNVQSRTADIEALSRQRFEEHENMQLLLAGERAIRERLSKALLVAQRKRRRK